MIFKNTIYLLNKVVKYGIHQIFLYNCSFINQNQDKRCKTNIVIYRILKNTLEYLNHI